MPGGRPRKPHSELELSGAFKKDPQRLTQRLNAPQAEGKVGAPPNHLNPLQKEIWREVVAALPRGVAGKSDRMSIEMICRYWATVRKHGLGGRLGLSPRDVSLLLQLFGKYGLTAADRQRLTIKDDPDPDEVNDFSEFLVSPHKGVQ